MPFILLHLSILSNFFINPSIYFLLIYSFLHAFYFINSSILNYSASSTLSYWCIHLFLIIYLFILNLFIYTSVPTPNTTFFIYSSILIHLSYHNYSFIFIYSSLSIYSSALVHSFISLWTLLFSFVYLSVLIHLFSCPCPLI